MWRTHHFEFGAQDPELAEPHVERGAGEAAVGLLHHHHVYGAGQSRGVDLVVELAKVRYELANIVHRIHGGLGNSGRDKNTTLLLLLLIIFNNFTLISTYFYHCHGRS